MLPVLALGNCTELCCPASADPTLASGVVAAAGLLVTVPVLEVATAVASLGLVLLPPPVTDWTLLTSAVQGWAEEPAVVVAVLRPPPSVSRI